MGLLIRWIFIKLKILPRKPSSSKKPSTKKHKKKKASEKKEPKRKVTLSSVIDLLRFLKKSCKLLLKSIHIRNMDFSILAGGSDPYEAFLNYGKLCMSSGILNSIILNSFQVKDYSIAVDLSEESNSTQWTGQATAYVRPLFLLLIAIVLLINLPIRIIKKKESENE